MLITPEQFDEFKSAVQLSSATDPEDNPYRSKYKARDKFQALLEDLEAKSTENANLSADDSESKDLFLILYLRAALNIKLGENYNDTEERPTAEKCFNTALDIVSDHEMCPYAISIYISALNLLGFIYADRGEPYKSKEFLERSETAFHKFQHSFEGCSQHPCDTVASLTDSNDVGTLEQTSIDNLSNESSAERTTHKTLVLDIPALFTRAVGLKGVNTEVTDSLNAEFEKLHSYTLYYLAQVHRSLGNDIESAKYCQITLMRQLESGVYDPVDWAINCATLSQYFIGDGGNENFPQARHCLISADEVLRKHVAELDKEKEAQQQQQPLAPPENGDGDNEEDREVIGPRARCARAEADVNRCWAKYCLALLESSKEKLLQDQLGFDFGKEKCDADNLELRFSHLLSISPAESEIIASEYVTTFEEARKLFLKGQSSLQISRNFYKLDEHCTDHVEIIQDSGSLYKALAFFEPTNDRKCKMHKRRITMLNDVVKELNTTYYLLLCRQLWFQLGESANELLDLKLDAMNENDKDASVVPTLQQITKLNLIIKQAIGFFTAFLESFRNKAGEMPKQFDEDNVRPAILAHFYMGRIWSKWHTSDIGEKIQHVNQSLAEYKWIVKYCTDRDPDAVPLVKSEYDLSCEMVTLLPMKMDRLKHLALTQP